MSNLTSTNPHRLVDWAIGLSDDGQAAHYEGYAEGVVTMLPWHLETVTRRRALLTAIEGAKNPENRRGERSPPENLRPSDIAFVLKGCIEDLSREIEREIATRKRWLNFAFVPFSVGFFSAAIAALGYFVYQTDGTAGLDVASAIIFSFVAAGLALGGLALGWRLSVEIDKRASSLKTLESGRDALDQVSDP